MGLGVMVRSSGASTVPTASHLMTTLKFFYNGIKVNGGILQKAFYCQGAYTPESCIPSGTITIYGKDYRRFSAEIRELLEVRNDTDSMSDYFETDRIYVKPDHPLYAQVLTAFNLQEDKAAKRRAKRMERYSQAIAA